MSEPLLMGQPPWHLWGQSRTMEAAATVAGSGVASEQFGRVGYKRPDTFSFFLAAEIVMGSALETLTRTVTVDVHIIPGVGLVMFDTFHPGSLQVPFARFNWIIPAGVSPKAASIQQKKWTTRVRSPLMDDADATSFQDSDVLPAQDLQVQATLRVTVPAPPAAVVPITMKVTALFAPRTHVRPDWFIEGPDSQAFIGGELRGK